MKLIGDISYRVKFFLVDALARGYGIHNMA
jgi:hypothetical protein